MKLALIIIGSTVGLLILLAVTATIVGSRMPPDHTVSRSLQVNRRPAEVYAIVRNFGQAAEWRRDVKRVDVLAADRFREHGSNGAITYQIVDDVPNQRIVTKIVDVDLGYSGSWEYALQDTGNGTLVMITERGIVSNPLFRFMSRYIFGHTATIDAYLRSLEARLETKT
jgi:Polyketide cyclase / dehydrase and lipid transport